MSKKFKNLACVIGFMLICGGVFRLWSAWSEFANLEQSEGVIVNFHTHAGDPEIYHPNISFVYQGDTIIVKGIKDEEGEYAGKKVSVVFPPDKPHEAKIKSVPWFFSAFLILAGIWFVGFVGYITALERVDSQRKILETAPVPKFQSKIPIVALFGFLAVLLIWLTCHFTLEKIKNPNNSTEIVGLILLGFLAFIFTSIVLLNIFSLVVESKMITIDAQFSKLLGPFRELSTSGNVSYFWRIQCKWLNPATNQWVMFTSSLISGAELYYPQPFIRVQVLAKKPSQYYVVNLALVSQTPASGLTLLDKETMNRWIEKEARWKESVHRMFDRSLRARIGRLLNRLFTFLQRHQKIVQGISIVLVLLGIAHVGQERDDPFETDTSDYDIDNDASVP